MSSDWRRAHRVYFSVATPITSAVERLYTALVVRPRAGRPYGVLARRRLKSCGYIASGSCQLHRVYFSVATPITSAVEQLYTGLVVRP